MSRDPQVASHFRKEADSNGFRRFLLISNLHIILVCNCVSQHLIFVHTIHCQSNDCCPYLKPAKYPMSSPSSASVTTSPVWTVRKSHDNDLTAIVGDCHDVVNKSLATPAPPTEGSQKTYIEGMGLLQQPPRRPSSFYYYHNDVALSPPRRMAQSDILADNAWTIESPRASTRKQIFDSHDSVCMEFYY